MNTKNTLTAQDAAKLRSHILPKLAAADPATLELIYSILPPADPAQDAPEPLPLEELRAAFPWPTEDDAAQLVEELREDLTQDKAEELAAQIFQAVEPAGASSQYWKLILAVRESYCRGYAAGALDAQRAARQTLEDLRP